ncbi:hypothetical protein [Candidatus Nitrosocosmicus franklandus]|uniref:Uncharacterized protein n=1 Tax=Candidatus Nitrosocosmicus franklandianus TaxID=1798806 RepID=A0A484I6A6_9ARCH|nr:hypothetical protein [Candidatus Nitrosocosmicus franklandus]VFJ12718.1 protein of unknown function [Candidatus Nitrosocosmicus franklandus]
MRLRTFCSITIIPTLILILFLLSSVDNYLPETQIYGHLDSKELDLLKGFSNTGEGLTFQHLNLVTYPPEG